MTDSSLFTVLVAADLSNPPFLSRPLLRRFSALDVLLLGWMEVPDQTSTEQARRRLGEEAWETLRSVAGAFEVEGVVARPRLVFTRDRYETIERVSAQEGCDGVLIPRPSPEITRLLLPLRGTANADGIARAAACLAWQEGSLSKQGLDEDELAVTLLHVAEEKERSNAIGTSATGASTTGATLLKEAGDFLAREGIDVSRMDLRLHTGLSPAEAIGRKARRGDLVLIGESAPSIRNAFLGSRTEKIVRETTAPVLVVKQKGETRLKAPAIRAVGSQA